MAVGWNDTFDGSTDFSATATLNMFIAAVNQRFVFSGGPVGFPIASVADGDDVQRSAIVSQLQNAISSHINVYLVVNNSADGRAWDGVENGPTPNWTWADYKTAHLGGNEWTRKYPREFASAASTAYLDAAAFANGHVARNVATGLVYTRTAGAWVETAGALPDAVTAYGTAAAGDYIGSWLFTEIRDALNRMVWVFASISTSANNARTVWDNGGGDTDWTTAKAIADGNYAATIPTTDDLFVPLAYTLGTFNNVTGIYTAQATRATASLFASTPLFGAANAQVDFYVVMDAPSAPSGSGGGGAGNYDANGDGFAYRVWKKFDSQAQGGATSLMSLTIGTGAEPAWCAGPGDPPPTALGYRMAKARVIQRFDVAGGFTYRP